MRKVIIVKSFRKQSTFTTFCYAVYGFFAWLGEGVLQSPNKAIYALIVFLCILAPIFAIIMVIALLCGIYRRWKPEF